MNQTRNIADRPLRNSFWNLLIALLFLPLIAAPIFLTQMGDQLLLPNGCTLDITCPFRLLFGTVCPSCGMMRSFVALAHFDIAASFRFHPIGPVLMAVYLFIVGNALYRSATRKAALWSTPLFKRLIETAAAVSILIGVARYVITF